MTAPFRFRPNQPVSWFSTNKRQSNQHCLYCGTLVGVNSAGGSNREHLVARNFVPPGSLDAVAFNFIFRACVTCNAAKADAERHVSSITLLTSPARAQDTSVDELALRKASTDFHPTIRGSLVKDASMSQTLEARHGTLTMSFGLVGPPQLEKGRTLLLACNQVQALFSLVTSTDPRKGEQTRLLPPSQWHYLGYYSYEDWGNVELVEVSQRVRAWPVLLRIETARGFFKALLRVSDGQPEDWFWALEWNRSVRIVGSIYSGEDPPSVFNDLPEPDWKQITPTKRMLQQIPLAEASDLLFTE